MPAIIKASEITWLDPVRIDFGFSGLSENYAKAIMRDIIREEWPENRRPQQCVYVIRLTGVVAVAYPYRFSPVVYIGEGTAYNRLYGHAEWLAPLVLSVPQMGLEIHIAEVARRNHAELYRHVEADLIQWFQDEYGALPWFNSVRERKMEGHYDYDDDAIAELRQHFGVGRGNKFLWAIQPTHNNDLHDVFTKGTVSE